VDRSAPTVDDIRTKTTKGTEARALAEAYFSAWKAHDWTALRAVLADDATFRGPLGEADDGDACVAGLTGMTDIEVRARVADDTDVITFFDLHTKVAPPSPTAKWVHVVDGRVASIRVTFDPRPLLG